jgi:hypothetical protein
VTDYGLDLSVFESRETGCGSNRASYSTDTEVLSRGYSGGIAAGCEVDHLFLCSADVKKE